MKLCFSSRFKLGKLLLITFIIAQAIGGFLAPKIHAAADSYKDRVAQLLSVFASESPPFGINNQEALFYAQARFATNTDVETALSWVDQINNGSHPGSMFYYYNDIDTYLKFKHLYSDELIAKVKTDLTTNAKITYSTANGTTENHRLMFKTAGYLIAQTWPEWSEAATELASNKQQLEEILSQYVHFGLAEYDSPIYNAITVNCLMSLAEFVQDPQLKQKAKMTLESMLANIGSQWTNGYYISSSLRMIGTSITPQEGYAGTIQAWLIWGGRTPLYPNSLSDHNTEAYYSVATATSTYRMPAILERIGQDRSQPFIHKANGNWNGRTSKVTYMTDKFGLASQVELNQLGWADQLRRWVMRWDSDEPGSTFFMTHPRLAGEYKGATKYEQVMQHNGTLIGVYNIPTSGTIDGTNPILQYIEGPISTAAARKMMEDNGWVLIHGGSTLLAVNPVKGYTWASDRTINSQTFKTLRSENNKNGIILEAVPASAYEIAGESGLPENERLTNELSRFANDIKANTVIDASHLDETNPRLVYTALSGDVMDITYQYTGSYNGNRKLNGQAIAYDNWPLLDNPYMHQDYNGHIWTVSHGGETYTYDFGSWTVIASPPDNQTPSAPANLTSTGKTISTVDLSWAPSTDLAGVAGYKIYRNNTEAGTSATTSFKDTRLTGSTTYSYSIKAFDAAGNLSAASNAINVTTSAPPAPGTGTGLKGDYFDNIDLTNLKTTRTDATVNFNWGTGSPDPSIASDTFSVRWTGQVQPQYSEAYTFYVKTDNGVRLWVNNQLLVDKWIDQPATEWSGMINLTGGHKYDIKMEYFENGGGASASLSWSSASKSKEVIPQERLYLPLLFSDSFESGTASSWNAGAGSWSVVTDDTYVYRQSLTAGTNNTTAGDTAWSHYGVEAKVKITGTVNIPSVDLMGRYTDGNNFYFLKMSLAENKLKLYKKVNGSVSLLGSEDCTFQANQWYTLKLSMFGTEIKGYVNGTELLSVSDGSLTAGKIGLRTTDAAADFDDITVQ